MVAMRGVPPAVDEELNAATGGIMLNVAVTALLSFMVSWQGAVPVQTPDQPAKVELASGVAVRVIKVPARNELQLLPQDMPAGVLVTVPPVLTEVVRLYVLANDAVIVWLTMILENL